ncbi:hypothetical protein B7R54_00235 [Subtercola boreus]|uniref:Uncharacterized protein n=1 Tax=Subtercola boreus TaxID=120213 RepID=A0A3E0VDI5_9MICO|nr:hypothetical protein [Subtercola boreus]RFA07811.1 hypothetical protein B7R54_00235 [Subtercola boreus]TQL55342.1 hypothetical protein FB464_2905 [Subtercola boreus]
MMMFWFTVGFAALLVLMSVLLIIRQHRSKDFQEKLDPHDLPRQKDALSREFDAGIHRGGGNGAGPGGF